MTTNGLPKKVHYQAERMSHLAAAHGLQFTRQQLAQANAPLISATYGDWIAVSQSAQWRLFNFSWSNMRRPPSPDFQLYSADYVDLNVPSTQERWTFAAPTQRVLRALKSETIQVNM